MRVKKEWRKRWRKKTRTNKKSKIIILIAIVLLIAVVTTIIVRNVIISKQIEKNEYLAIGNENSSLLAGYIRKGVTIGGVTGTLESLDTEESNTKVDEGIIITDGTNEFVWVPVKNPSAMFIEETVKLNLVDTTTSIYSNLREIFIEDTEFGAGKVLTAENGNWYTLYKACQNVIKNNSDVKSTMIYGCQWDEIMIWLKKY